VALEGVSYATRNPEIPDAVEGQTLQTKLATISVTKFRYKVMPSSEDLETRKLQNIKRKPQAHIKI